MKRLQKLADTAMEETRDMAVADAPTGRVASPLAPVEVGQSAGVREENPFA